MLNVSNLTNTPATFFASYADKVNTTLASFDWSGVVSLAEDMHRAWTNGNQVFMCGNGGSAGNAIHLVNDLVYGSRNNAIDLLAGTIHVCCPSAYNRKTVSCVECAQTHVGCRS